MTGFLEPHVLPEGPATPTLERLNPRRRAFVLHYVLGDEGVRGVIYKAYMAAGFTAANVNVAGSAGHQLLQDPLVKLAIDEVRQAIELGARARMKSWAEMALRAQDALDAVITTIVTPELTDDERKIQEVAGLNPPKMGYLPDGRPRMYIGTTGLAAIKEVLDRALGRPTQPHVHELGDRLDNLIKKLHHQNQHPTLPAGHGLEGLEEIEVPQPQLRLEGEGEDSDL